nr:MAG TPA: hypothetical protein [Bacteriophage sp.]
MNNFKIQRNICKVDICEYFMEIMQCILRE